VLHITGPQHAVEVDGHPAGPPYVVIPYVEEMQYAYAAAGRALLVDNGDLDPAWIETTLIPVLTDPGRIAAMSARASAAGAPDADLVLARYVLTAVAERRVVAP
jgi:UDP-N-acetylglucosamine--N-acetylmuramyl-(pentapeptide) pyrophosphoryl-undecaprenol N-acetylglucosamine transferase